MCLLYRGIFRMWAIPQSWILCLHPMFTGCSRHSFEEDWQGGPQEEPMDPNILAMFWMPFPSIKECPLSPVSAALWSDMGVAAAAQTRIPWKENKNKNTRDIYIRVVIGERTSPVNENTLCTPQIHGILRSWETAHKHTGSSNASSDGVPSLPTT